MAQPPSYTATAAQSSAAAAGVHDQRSIPFSFHFAAEAGDDQHIKSILADCEREERNRALNFESYGELPLHCAARGGHLKALELLMPKDLPDLVNAQSKNAGWSALHLAAAFGHAHVVQWIVLDREADLDLKDEEGNTPTHLAVALEHKAVVRWLVLHRGADVSIPNQHNMMPMSFCKDGEMFAALLPAYLPDSELLKRVNKHSLQICLASDGDGRNILHYAAEFSRDPQSLGDLILQFGEDLGKKDKEGDSFLLIAAKSGNVPMLQALEKLQSFRPDVSELIRNSGADLDHSPALYALFHGNRDFFDKIITMDRTAEVTLRNIISALDQVLKKDILIKDRLRLFGGSLPTYLALYAKKDCIFDFLLETKTISLTQRDSKYYRTCLHWAVLDGRVDILEKLCKEHPISPAIPDNDGKRAFQHAFEKNDRPMMDIMWATQAVKADEENLYRDRDVYVQALNAILVGAALIASIAFAGYLQWPATVDFNSTTMKIFWASNSTSFFTAMATMCVATGALIPIPHQYVGEIVDRLQVAILIDAGLFALSIAAATCAFAAVGFAAAESLTLAYHVIMRVTTEAAGGTAILMWIWFVLRNRLLGMRICKWFVGRLWRGALPGLAIGIEICKWCVGLAQDTCGRPAEHQGHEETLPQPYTPAYPGYHSVTGYPSLTKDELKDLLDKDLASIVRSKTPNIEAESATTTKRHGTALAIRAKLGASQRLPALLRSPGVHSRDIDPTDLLRMFY